MSTEYLPREVAFWGPSSSGKTWLMQSLARSLHKINEDDPEFEYVLAQPEALAPTPALASGASVNAQAPQNQATSDAYDKVWLFQRKVRPEHDTPAHRLSAQCHSIVVRDAPGELLMQGVNNVVMVPLRDAQCIIAVLDPSLIDSTTTAAPAAQPERTAAQGLAALFGSSAAAPAGTSAPAPAFGASFQYTQAQYAQMVSNLLQLLSSAPRPDRHVAVCVTKVDQLGVQGRSPWQVIEVYFGAEMTKVLKSYAGKMEIEAFCVSSAGFLDAFRQQPNYDPGTGSLLSAERWQPFAVETPFFWLFTFLERQRLAQGGGRVPRWYFRADRLAHYIGYPTRVY
jgi:hypothetical protein